jgi:UDP-N-acetyl-D-galactosamine dehydrogenase
VKIGVIGLGYVGFPLAFHFSRVHEVVGFDTDPDKLSSGRNLVPRGKSLELTGDPRALQDCNTLCIAVPTPVDGNKRPDLTALETATHTAAHALGTDSTVIFESTVFPGATEEVCIPILERQSGLTWKKDFSVAYSPERINPGDELHSLESVVKVVSGDTPETAKRVAALYREIVPAGVHIAPSIRVAEAAKVIENTQRDLNIALMNELAVIFNMLGLDTAQVLEAAGTKWNFLPFRPGLVGGHCIGVDPYYLTHKAETLGYHPQVILAGRRINDGMGKYIAEQTVKRMIANETQIRGAQVNILGLAFKENCDDARNTRVAEIATELESYGVNVAVHDPRVENAAAERECGIHLVPWEALPAAQGLILAVPHREYLDRPLDDLLRSGRPGAVVVDVKSALDAGGVERLGYHLWRL